LNRIYTIKAADLAMGCGRCCDRHGLHDLAVEAFEEAARLYRVAWLSLMARAAKRCIVAVVKRPEVTT
jgi:hypothetical protein